MLLQGAWMNLLANIILDAYLKDYDLPFLILPLRCLDKLATEGMHEPDFLYCRLILHKPSFLQIAPVEGLEPPTSRLTIADSYQLNYTGITIQIYKFLKYL